MSNIQEFIEPSPVYRACQPQPGPSGPVPSPRLALLSLVPLIFALTLLLATTAQAAQPPAPNAQRSTLNAKSPTPNAQRRGSTKCERPGERQTPAAPSFVRDVMPIFRAACVGCHGDKNASARLSLTSYTALLKGGQGGAELVPGKSHDSRLYGYLVGTLKPVMPLGGALKPEQIALIARWIDAGAHDDTGTATAGSTVRAVPMPMVAAPVPVTALAFSPDGKTLAVGLYRQVQLWDTATSRLSRTWNGHAGALHSLTFSKDGKWLAAGGGEPGVQGEVRIWDVTAAAEARVLGEHTDVVNAVAFSPDGKRLATGSSDKTVRLWDLATGHSIVTLADHSDAVTGVAYSPDGKTLVSASLDRSLKVWDAAAGKRLYSLDAHDDGLTGVEFSPDGKSLLSCSADRSARIWKFGRESSELVVNLTGHDGPVLAATFAPDGKTLATASADKVVKLWTVSGANTHTLTGAQDWLYAVRFTPDGKQVAAGSWDGQLYLWSTTDGRPVATLPTFSRIARSPSK